jgi:hypothetical protein
VPFSKTFAPGEVLTASDVNEHLLNGGYQFRETLYFTSSGTFTKATYPWLRAIRVKVVGGGGAGGGTQTTGVGEQASGGGGGGGGYAELFITDIAGLVSPVTVTVGAGGAGVVNAGGNNGSASSFGTLAVAGGGSGGTRGPAISGNQTPNPGGTGGIGTAGDIIFRGDDGSEGRVVGGQRTSFGHGGGSVFAGSRRITNDNALNGHLYGGAGSGANATPSTAEIAGGNGAAGIVIVELYG